VAGAIAFVKYRLPISSSALMDKLRTEQSVLVTPAAHFGLAGKYVRIGFGYDVDYTLRGLARVDTVLKALRSR
jgi:aspartate/methionine/tyrosine aminotransferase